MRFTYNRSRQFANKDVDGLTGIPRLFANWLERLLCTWGISYPDDAHSGIIIGGVEYPVVMSFSGKYYYLDADGKMQELPINEDGTPAYTWENINEKHVLEVDQCFSTLGGEVGVKIYRSVNDQLETLATKIYVVNSTDNNILWGEEFDAIPSNWTAKDCEIADLTERYLAQEQRCYVVGEGDESTVTVEGNVLYNANLQEKRLDMYVVKETNSGIAVGTRYTSIPNDWILIVCA